MKKKNLKSLKLNKNSISNMSGKNIVGGTSGDRKSANRPPTCLVRESENFTCTLAEN
jgi:hypothetical protein